MKIEWKGYEILIDEEDAHLVAGRTVHVDTNGYVRVEWGGRRKNGGQRHFAGSMGNEAVHLGIPGGLAIHGVALV